MATQISRESERGREGEHHVDMKQAFTNTGKNPGKPTVAGAAAAKTGRAAGRRAQQMPMCSYGLSCNRRDCVYRHPSQKEAAVVTSNQVCKPFLAGLCQYGKGCYNRHPSGDEAEQLRRKFASTMCRWGTECQSEGCLFSHPWDGAIEVCEEIPADDVESSVNLMQLPDMSELDVNAHTTLTGLENVPQFPVGLSAAASEWQPSTAASEWQPSTAASEWQPSMTATEWKPSAAASEWQPSVTATEWKPSAAASEWQPSAAASEWQPNVTATTWQPSAAASEWQPGVAASEWQPSAAASEWQPCGALGQAPHATPYKPSAGSWAAVANTAPAGKDGAAVQGPSASSRAPWSAGASGRRPTVKMPRELWLAEVARVEAATAFAIADPIQRFEVVNEPHRRRAATQALPPTLAATIDRGGTVGVLDLHFQSVRIVYLSHCARTSHAWRMMGHASLAQRALTRAYWSRFPASARFAALRLSWTQCCCRNCRRTQRCGSSLARGITPTSTVTREAQREACSSLQFKIIWTRARRRSTSAKTTTVDRVLFYYLHARPHEQHILKLED